MKVLFYFYFSSVKVFAIILFLSATTTAVAGYRTLLDSNRYVTVSTGTDGVESVWFCYPDKLECDVTATNAVKDFVAEIRIEPRADWELLTEDGTGTVSGRTVIMRAGDQVKYRVRHKDTAELSPWGLVVLFRADAILDDVGETGEETDGAFLPEIPSRLSPDDEAFRSACRVLRFDLQPVHPPTPDRATLVWSGVRIFEVEEDGAWSEIQSGVQYPWNELASKIFRVAGAIPSAEERDHWIKVEHRTNKCTDTAWLTCVKLDFCEFRGDYANRRFDRSKVGVAEEMHFWIVPSSLKVVKWKENDSDATTSFFDSTDWSTGYNAPTTAGMRSISATLENGFTIRKTLSVVEPSGYSVRNVIHLSRAELMQREVENYIDQNPGASFEENLGILEQLPEYAGVGAIFRLALHPLDVSFATKVEIMETDQGMERDGYFNSFPTADLEHRVNGAEMGFVAVGSSHIVTDEASIYGYPSPWCSGYLEWSIHCRWRCVEEDGLNLDEGKEFPWSNQRFDVTPAGIFSVMKFGKTILRAPTEN